jgi:hypothetical protein
MRTPAPFGRKSARRWAISGPAPVGHGFNRAGDSKRRGHAERAEPRQFGRSTSVT